MSFKQFTAGKWGGFKLATAGVGVCGLSSLALEFLCIPAGVHSAIFLAGWLGVMVGFVIHVRRMHQENRKESRERMFAKAKQPWET
ncbi:hypothetical protein GPA22_22375 [Aromatoleum toluvorans]|uniref:Uncharacterized protein n=1 Tax=Aromatoleum toluvorans TaxID=92002 RepID=A0ABX1Q7X9_9RHOO|nr:hypothetical protein [Aromatoleum toluvorans]NMG46461.1 hypothetical protein [Aromatoleum toluvorans]